MLLALVIWTLIVVGGWWFGAALLALVTPGAVWLDTNPAFAEWLQPVLGFFAGQAIAAAAMVWLVGALLITLIIRPRAAARRKQALSYDEWQRLDGGAAERRPPPAAYDDDYPRSRRWRRRRRRRDDDDDDDDDD